MSILHRTVYYDITNGISMFWDWCQVSTTIGTMVEPFIVGAKFATNTPLGEFDPNDEIARIDTIRSAQLDTEGKYLSGGQGHLHGGSTLPRLSR